MDKKDVVYQAELAMLYTDITCPRCKGGGRVRGHPWWGDLFYACEDCCGKGTIRVPRNLQMREAMEAMKGIDWHKFDLMRKGQK